MILFLDTSDFKKLRFALIEESRGRTERGKAARAKIKTRSVSVKYNESEKTLPELQKLIGNNFGKISAIYAVSGPGSFTGIRVGISIALAFSFAKKIPLYALKKDKVPKNLSGILKLKNLKNISSNFELDYGAEPNITFPV